MRARLACGVWLTSQLVVTAAAASPASVRYAISLADSDRRTGFARAMVEVDRAPASLMLHFAPWLKGAYELRLFGREVRALEATGEGGRSLTVRRTGVGDFVIEGQAAGTPVVVRYRIGASLLSDDGADFTAEHAYFNPGAVLPEVGGRRDEPHALALVDVPAGWRAYSELAESGLSFTATSFERLCDAPIEVVEADRVTHLERDVAGARFELVADEEGATTPPRLPQALLDDLARIVTAERALAGPLPFSRYVVLLHLSDRPGRDVALEHSASTSLVLSRADLAGSDGYAAMLHMLAHEIFHAWNARRLIPRELPSLPLQTSPALWITEGLTEHAAVVAQRRSGILSGSALATAISEAATRARDAEGARLSLSDLSLLAGAPPGALSADPDAYYAIGHVVSLALVAELLTRSEGRVGLEELLAALLPPPTATARIVDLEALGRVADTLVPRGTAPVSSLLREWVNAPFSLARLQPSLERIGITLRSEKPTGADTSALIDGTPPVLRALPPGGAWHRAGAKAGDRLSSIDGLPTTPEAVLRLGTGRAPVGRPIRVEVDRVGTHLRLILEPRPRPVLVTFETSNTTPKARAWRARLLGEPPATAPR